MTFVGWALPTTTPAWIPGGQRPPYWRDIMDHAAANGTDLHGRHKNRTDPWRLALSRVAYALPHRAGSEERTQPMLFAMWDAFLVAWLPPL
jgi:hypothetical protein